MREVKMKVKPLFDRVLILPEEQNEQKSGIILPDTAKEKPQFGTIVAVGDGENLDYTKSQMKVKVGNKVIFNKYAGAEIKLDNTIYILMRQIDIIGVIENV